MVTSPTWERRALFHAEPWARLLIDTLYHYRGTDYLLHEFVVMPDHFHALITPQTSLEKAVQFIKGGFSYRAKKELGSSLEIWQKGFQDHRIRDASDLAAHVIYIHDNPVKEHLCERPDEFPYSSAHAGFKLDAVPQGLKPQVLGKPVAARLEGVPFQNTTSNQVELNSAAKATPIQSGISSPDETNSAAKIAPLQKGTSSRGEITDGAAEAAPFQSKIEPVPLATKAKTA
jgi:putative transposase